MYHNTANLVFPNQKSDTLVLTDSGLSSRKAVITNHNTYEIQLINIYKLVFKSLPNRMSRYQNRPLVFQHYDMHRIVPTGPCVPVVGLPVSHLLARLSCVLTSCGHYATYILARLPGTTRPRQPKTIYFIKLCLDKADK